FSPDGRTLASYGLTAAGDGEVKFWGTATWHPARAWSIPGETVDTIVFSPDGTRLACSIRSADGTKSRVEVRDVATGDGRALVPPHPAAVRNLAYSPDGTLLAVPNTTGSVTVVDAHTGREVWGRRGERPVWCVAFSADGRLVAAGSGAE